MNQVNQLPFLNLTPHAISIVVGETTHTIEPCGETARVAVTQEMAGECCGVPVYRNVFGDVQGLPETKTRPILVSAMVLARLGKEWAGFAFAPDTGRTAIRNEAGHIVAVTQLVGVGV